MFSFFKKTKENISNLFKSKSEKISKEMLEEILIESDVYYDIVEKMLEHLGNNISRAELEVAFERFFRGESYYDKVKFKPIEAKPLVYLVLGVNGAGKTTTIAKLANKFKKEGKSVILGAGDTFRAGAIEQLELWSKKLEVDIITSKPKADPSALAFDTINASKARNKDIAIIDTAGRLQNQVNLKNELAKISKTCSKALDSKPFHKILILDGTQGAQSIEQAKIFHQMLDIDGIIITKLDGTSKGGSIFSIIYELKLPIVYLGVGEKQDDLIEFNQKDYINGLLDSIFNS